MIDSLFREHKRLISTWKAAHKRFFDRTCLAVHAQQKGKTMLNRRRNRGIIPITQIRADDIISVKLALPL
ncbi:hypothetical protein VFPPC_17659 [Pochonia chlamydosporia 170]|uniref:Uncharacterized protein n=1 Tax=Pochonia chlamydosporia 170 TaxID=1380566 RepID=A0A219ASH4_METCM|nr:hypothetical protein VFPPC_17659 [Pochonia chlamydosporia 170]OWT43165.1 hypothetical protein VFPPC_17659 [Pochonia chlamydosporia 170]